MAVWGQEGHVWEGSGADLGRERYGQSYRDVLNPDEQNNVWRSIYSFKENMSDNKNSGIINSNETLE